MDLEAALTPAQQRVVTDLMARDQPRPQFDRSLGDHLRHQLEETLEPLVADATETIHVPKNALAQVHACEANYLAELNWPGWNAANAEGVVTHRAVQLSVSLGDSAPPLLLVDHAIEELMADEGSDLGLFLGTMSDPARAELRGKAGNAVATFLECWPPLRSAWHPRTELPVRVDLCGGRIVLRGKIDLVLGQARGMEARCLFLDLKTGNHYSSHLDDLRFYALIQTIRIGVPPFRVASYYLDSAAFVAEDVTEETLEIALHRTEAGVAKIIELRTKQRDATITPCPRCRYCRVRATCDGARQWEARDQDDG